MNLNGKFKGISLFAGAGIAEMLLHQTNFEIVCANELLKDRCELYQKIYNDNKIIQGDILSLKNIEKIKNFVKNLKIDFILASPPCQGMSLAGKHRTIDEMKFDKRNLLILSVLDFINFYSPNFIFIENVPYLHKLKVFRQNEFIDLKEVLTLDFGNDYYIYFDIVNCADFCVPQTRNRAIIRMIKKNCGYKWVSPSKSKKISVYNAIGHLPSLEAGQSSDIPFHYARRHSEDHISVMKNTPTGQSAFDNEVFFPQKNGRKIKGFKSSYRRIQWDNPAPTITMRNDAISSQRNVHPGRRNADNTYSDARVLTLLELMILNSMPIPSPITESVNELLLRRCIGESFPPIVLKTFLNSIFKL